jgi:hypothetical protein
MKCPFKENDKCCKQMGKCILAVFLTILGTAVVLKIITLILSIFPGSNHGNAWLVVISVIMVLFAAKYHKKGNCCCGPNCNCDDSCPCNKGKKTSECCDSKETCSNNEEAKD